MHPQASAWEVWFREKGTCRKGRQWRRSQCHNFRRSGQEGQAGPLLKAADSSLHAAGVFRMEDMLVCTDMDRVGSGEVAGN